MKTAIDILKFIKLWALVFSFPKLKWSPIIMVIILMIAKLKWPTASNWVSTTCHRLCDSKTLRVPFSDLSIYVASFIYSSWSWIILRINQIWPLRICLLYFKNSPLLIGFTPVVLIATLASTSFHSHLCVLSSRMSPPQPPCLVFLRKCSSS